MKYLIFSELSRNHFLFLSYFIICIIEEIVKKYIKSGKDIIFEFNKFYIHALSNFISIIPLIIIHIRSKSIKNNQLNENKSSKNTKNICADINKKKLKRIIKLLIILSIFHFLAIYVNVIFDIIYKTNKIEVKEMKFSSDVLINISCKYILSILILHLPIYRHHYLSLAIYLIFLILLIIGDIIYIEYARAYFYMIKIISIIIFYSVDNVCAKILLSFDSISPYKCLLYRGIFVNILSFINFLVFIFVELPDENGIKSCVFTRLWKLYDNKLNILFYIIWFFIIYLFYLNIYFILDKFSPIHFAIGSILEKIGSNLISIIYGEIKISEFFIKLTIYFILILAALIYNEFIILNFCGLQKYTKLFLLKAANKDIELTIQKNINNDFFLENENNQNERIKSNSNDEFRETNFIEVKGSNLIEIMESISTENIESYSVKNIELNLVK